MEATEHDGEIVIDEVVDIEVYVREQKTVPLARAYRIRIDKPYYVVEVPKMTGRQILELAGKNPPEDYVLRQIIHGQPVKVEHNAVVDFRTPGVEKFKTMLKTAQDGTL
ncbi:multiubiquitin domain-containing protein [Phenylobacterium sp.]|uniref:multiubiquitin domain-containing protein n=1 Tax=Phenylobacterium sp. TaxID=1871053 RepID=UPI0035B110F3